MERCPECGLEQYPALSPPLDLVALREDVATDALAVREPACDEQWEVVHVAARHVEAALLQHQMIIRGIKADIIQLESMSDRFSVLVPSIDRETALDLVARYRLVGEGRQEPYDDAEEQPSD